MINQENNQNQRNNKSVAKSIINTAGSAFETAHSALERDHRKCCNEHC